MGLRRPRADDFVVPEKVVPFEAVPIFGCQPFGANTTCDAIHPGGPIPDGSRCYCVVCCATGRDDHPKLQRTASDLAYLKAWYPENRRDEWTPMGGTGAEPTVYTPPKSDAPLTRKQRRAIQYAHRLASGANEAAPMDPAQLDHAIESRHARVLA